MHPARHRLAILVGRDHHPIPTRRAFAIPWQQQPLAGRVLGRAIRSAAGRSVWPSCATMGRAPTSALQTRIAVVQVERMKVRLFELVAQSILKAPETMVKQAHRLARQFRVLPLAPSWERAAKSQRSRVRRRYTIRSIAPHPALAQANAVSLPQGARDVQLCNQIVQHVAMDVGQTHFAARRERTSALRDRGPSSAGSWRADRGRGLAFPPPRSRNRRWRHRPGRP